MDRNRQDATISLGEGETAVVGFGLLLARSTVDQTLGHSYDGPFVRGHLDGWRRTWGVSMPNAAYYYREGAQQVYPDRIAYLNLEPTHGSVINCVVIVLGPTDLAKMDGREWIYERRDVTEDLRGVRIDGDNALVYIGRPQHRHSHTSTLPNVAVRRSYVDGLDRVLESLDPSIAMEFRASTESAPRALIVNDILDPDRPNPWKAAGHTFRPDH